MMKKKKAFTLIELIIVIAIIAILAAIAIPVFSNLTEKAKITQLEGDIKAIQNATILTYEETQEFIGEDILILNISKANNDFNFYLKDSVGIVKDPKKDPRLIEFMKKFDTLNLPFGVTYSIYNSSKGKTGNNNDLLKGREMIVLEIFTYAVPEKTREKIEAGLKEDFGSMYLGKGKLDELIVGLYQY